jgi:hypothetical protein
VSDCLIHTTLLASLRIVPSLTVRIYCTLGPLSYSGVVGPPSPRQKAIVPELHTSMVRSSDLSRIYNTYYLHDFQAFFHFQNKHPNETIFTRVPVVAGRFWSVTWNITSLLVIEVLESPNVGFSVLTYWPLIALQIWIRLQFGPLSLQLLHSRSRCPTNWVIRKITGTICGGEVRQFHHLQLVTYWSGSRERQRSYDPSTCSYCANVWTRMSLLHESHPL